MGAMFFSTSAIRQINNNMLKKIPSLQPGYSMSINLLCIKDLVYNLYINLLNPCKTPTPKSIKFYVLKTHSLFLT